MGRFEKLDFDEEKTAPVAPADPWPNLDETACLRLGDEQFDKGLYEPALNLYSRALRFNRDLPQAWTGQIRCLLMLQENPEALIWSDRALERFRDTSDLLACKGLAFAQSGNYEQGLEYSDGAVSLRAPTAWAWIARGHCLLLADEPTVNAHRCFLKALELAPNDWRTELHIAQIYIARRNWTAGQPLLLAAQKRERDQPLVLFNLGLMHEGLGDYDRAKGYLARAVASRPPFPSAQNALERVSNVNPLKRMWQSLRKSN